VKPKPKVVLKKMTPPTKNVSHQQSQSTTHMYSNVPITSSATTAYSYNSNFNNSGSSVNDNYTNNIFSNSYNSNNNHNTYNNGDVDNKDDIDNVTNQQQSSQFITQMYARESNKDVNDEGKDTVDVSHQQSQSVSQINSSAPNNNDDDDDDDEFDDGKDHDR
jgi:hypothetical protein